MVSKKAEETHGTRITFESVSERDIDLLIMRHFACGDRALIDVFMNKVDLEWHEGIRIESVKHSVMTSDGESDVEVVLFDGTARIAFLIEDKINAVAQPEQAGRYVTRAEKAKEKGMYDEYHIFIVAPQKYLDGNEEAAKYDNKVSYEELRVKIQDPFDRALLDKALDESKHGYVPIEDRRVTEFWDKLYDYVDGRFPGTFRIQGKKGQSRGTSATWITINSGKGTCIRIKAEKGYVDLEIAGHADKFQQFCDSNREIIDGRRLYVRTASKSLAIRKYIDPIDFLGSFEEQIERIYDAFIKAKELQELISHLTWK